MDPNFAIAHYELGQAYEQKNMHNEAIVEFRTAIQLSGDNEIFTANLGHAYASSGRREEALKMVKDLEDRQSQHSSTDANIALIYVGLGDRDQAMIRLTLGFRISCAASASLRPSATCSTDRRPVRPLEGDRNGPTGRVAGLRLRTACQIEPNSPSRRNRLAICSLVQTLRENRLAELR